MAPRTHLLPILIVAAGVVSPAVAAAQTVKMRGWTDDGRAVLEIHDPKSRYRRDEWAVDAPAKFFAVCEPQAPTAELPDCQVCEGVVDCGLPRKAKAPKPSATSPDKKLKLAATRACGDGACERRIALGDTGETFFHELSGGKKWRFDAYFRRDSGAVTIVAHDGTGTKARSGFRVIALGPERGAPDEDRPPPPPPALDRDAVAKGLDSVLGEVRACAPQLDPTLGALRSVAVAVLIEPDGRVSRAEVKTPSVAGTSFARCVEAAAARATFPRFRGKAFRVIHAFAL